LDKECSIPHPLLEGTKDSSTLIGGEQKFVHWAFTLVANGLQNIDMVAHFGGFGTQSLASERKFVFE
jgi:hypothetical protein